MLISIILPCFNEEGNLDQIYARLISVMQKAAVEYEILFVNDGSTDNSHDKLLSLSALDSRVKGFEFSRNFGHQAAISAGLDHAEGDVVIVMDADLQHPPELILSLLEKWREGYDIVNTIRRDPAGLSPFKKTTAKMFYKLINLLANTHIPDNSADFRLLDKKVVKEFRTLKERTKFLRGLVSWVGFRQCFIHYDAAPRYAGTSKYPVWKMIRFAFDGIVSFSTLPLHIATILGAIISVFSFVYASYAIYIRLITREALPGWTSVLVAVLFLGGIQLLSLGVFGEYLSRIYTEAKSRPTYIVRNTYGGKDPR